MSKQQLAYADEQFTEPSITPNIFLHEVLGKLDRRVTKNKRRLINGLLKKRPSAFDGPLEARVITGIPYV